MYQVGTVSRLLSGPGREIHDLVKHAVGICHALLFALAAVGTGGITTQGRVHRANARHGNNPSCGEKPLCLSDGSPQTAGRHEVSCVCGLWFCCPPSHRKQHTGRLEPVGSYGTRSARLPTAPPSRPRRRPACHSPLRRRRPGRRRGPFRGAERCRSGGAPPAPAPPSRWRGGRRRCPS